MYMIKFCLRQLIFIVLIPDDANAFIKFQHATSIRTQLIVIYAHIYAQTWLQINFATVTPSTLVKKDRACFKCEFNGQNSAVVQIAIPDRLYVYRSQSAGQIFCHMKFIRGNVSLNLCCGYTVKSKLILSIIHILLILLMPINKKVIAMRHHNISSLRGWTCQSNFVQLPKIRREEWLSSELVLQIHHYSR